MTCVLAACSATDLVGNAGSQTGGLLGSAEAVKSPEGALALYRGVLLTQAQGAAQLVAEVGLFTDELRPRFDRTTPTGGSDLDRRSLREESSNVDNVFSVLEQIRANARQGRTVLARYAPAAPPDLTGHLYAVEALTDVMLADLYCSGIPLSTVNPDGTFTLAAGSSTVQVYRTAVALFDSALAFAVTPDSTRLRYFAQVGKARALLALGQYDSAAAAVHDVPTEYTYGARPADVYYWSLGNSKYVSDREGGNGLPYVSAGDPRSSVNTLFDPQSLLPLYVATKYDPSGQTPLVLASGVEARLIEAEADLRKGGTEWLALLTTLRTDRTYTVAGSDTVWNPGTGGVAGLRPLVDPGAGTVPAGADPAAWRLRVRLDLLFAERAEWLFLTGHRQGDLRRRVRNDHVPQQQLYPSGAYPGGGSYGTDVNVPVPLKERAVNTHYDGCLNREA